MTERIMAVGSAREGEAALIARAVERLLSELFSGSRVAPSIHAVLCARADSSALAPSPELNRCLGRLVDIVRGQFDRELPARTRELVAHELWRTIVESPRLTHKAHEIRRIAAEAETQLEHHHCASLLRAWEGMSSARSLRDAFESFPYYDNYTHLVAAESVLLGSARRDVVAVCGCGPLPLTGLMLQQGGAQVVLIDRDAHALAGAMRIVRELARLGIVSERAFSFVHADVGELGYGCSDTDVTCDVVLVASLVPHPTKLQIAQRVSAPALLLLRSAAGLCAELAYEPVCTQRLRELGLTYCGESVPRHQPLDRRRTMLTPARQLRVAADASVLNTSELYACAPRAWDIDRQA